MPEITLCDRMFAVFQPTNLNNSFTDEQIQMTRSSETSHSFDFFSKQSMIENITVLIGNKRTIFPIPACPGSLFWAILRFMYINHSRPVSFKSLCDGVEKMMIERNPNKWKAYIEKESPKRIKNGKVLQNTKRHWSSRLLNNVRNLTRAGGAHACGHRLVVLGHAMTGWTDVNGNLFFQMHLEVTPEILAPKKKGRKKGSTQRKRFHSD